MPKEFVRKALCSALLCIFITNTFFFAPLNGAQAASSQIYVVGPSALNIRSDPSTNSFVLAKLKRGTLVKKSSSKHGWWYVKLKNGNAGYVDPKFLVPYSGGSSSSGYQKLSGKLYFINSRSRVTVRSGPSSHNKIKGKVRGGTVVRLIGRAGPYGYIEVYNNGNRGFVPLSKLYRYTH